MKHLGRCRQAQYSMKSTPLRATELKSKSNSPCLTLQRVHSAHASIDDARPSYISICHTCCLRPRPVPTKATTAPSRMQVSPPLQPVRIGLSLVRRPKSYILARACHRQLLFVHHPYISIRHIGLCCPLAGTHSTSKTEGMLRPPQPARGGVSVYHIVHVLAKSGCIQVGSHAAGTVGKVARSDRSQADCRLDRRLLLVAIVVIICCYSALRRASHHCSELHRLRFPWYWHTFVHRTVWGVIVATARIFTAHSHDSSCKQPPFVAASLPSYHATATLARQISTHSCLTA